MAVMPVEDAQKLTDLRVRMLENVRAGKKAIDGLTEDELSAVVTILRRPRANAMEAGAVKKTRAKKAGTADSGVPPTPLTEAQKAKFNKFLSLKLD